MDKDINTYYDVQKSKYLDKVKSYCAYSDRCHKDVMNKLNSLNVDSDMADDIVSELITQGYLNEERFVLAYVRGKFRINKWGKSKILRELKQRDISPYLVKEGLKEIDETEYFETLEKLILSKSKTFTAKNQYDRYQKLFSYAYRKGYESELIKEIIEDLF